MFLSSDPVEPATVNRAELAQILNCSLPTVTNLINRYTDFPIIEPGGQGKEWRFDAEAVVAFVTEKRAEEERAKAEKNDLLGQLTLPVGATTDDGKPISLKEQILAATLRAKLREEEIDSRFLVRTHEVRAALDKAFRGLNQNLDAALRDVKRDLNLPDPVMRALEAKFANARAAFVRDAAEYLAAPDDGGEFVLRA